MPPAAAIGRCVWNLSREKGGAQLFFVYLLGVALHWLAQLACAAVIASPIPLIVRLATKKKKAAKLVFALCLTLELAAIGVVAQRPFFRCPEEYRSYVSAEEEARIVGFYNGLWSPRVPVFPDRKSVV